MTPRVPSRVRHASIIAFSLLAACAEERSPESSPKTPIIGAVPPKAASASPAPSASSIASTALTPDGLGPLRIGMTRAEVAASLGPDADPEAVGGPEPERCDQFRPARAPRGVIVMMEDGRLTRVSLVEGATVRTERGLGIGATAEQVRAAYGGALKAERHEYAPPPGAYLTHWAEGGGGAADVRDASARGVRYEVGADGRVTAIHAGGPSILYAEGCA